MAFKLVIECSKDIDKLHIDFTDGTSVVTESKVEEKPEKINPTSRGKSSSTKSSKKQEKLLDTDEDYSVAHESDIIQLPEIKENDRPVSVADELQNLDV